MVKSINVKVPATTANVGSGFDVIGIALNIYNNISFKKSEITSVKVEGNLNLPENKNNLIFKSFEKFFEKVNLEVPEVEITISTEIPTSRGLGSSSSAIVAGITAANYFSANKLSKLELLNLANEIEGHPDNVAPCLLGGIVTSAVEDNLVYSCNIKTDLNLDFVVVIPEFELSTHEARKALPDKIDFSDAVFNSSRLAMLINGFYTNNLEMIKIGLKDKLHEQYRSKLIKGFNEVKNIGMENGAIGSVLSGAGPTILAITDKNAEKIGKAMQEKWSELGVNSKFKVLKIDYNGVEIIS